MSTPTAIRPQREPAEAGQSLLPRIEIDLGALAANWRRLAADAAPAACGAVVKADAYGLGLGPAALALARAGTRSFFVAHEEEGLALRRHLGPGPEIWLLSGCAPGQLPVCAEAGLWPVLNTPEAVQAFAGADGVQGGLMVETGMNRLGLPPESARAALAALGGEAGRIRLVLGHLACADMPDHPLNARQLAAFAALGDLLPGVPRSLANSGGMALGTAYGFDLVRPGIRLYGGSAGPRAPALAPVVRYTAPVLQIRTLAPGESVGYGATFAAGEPCRIATIGAGYADGVPRALSGRGLAAACGRHLPFVGRVSMDSFALDVSALPEGALAPGDSVELLGRALPLDLAADRAGTIGYELLTGLGRRPGRVYK
ncbi:MAG: alanine racemase [Alphaproteobacteria bacterium]|nr:alanine racemase [Alphaproteobacteria bacterium]